VRVRGATYIEYLAVVGVLALACVVGFGLFGTRARAAATCLGERVASLEGVPCGKDSNVASASSETAPNAVTATPDVVCDPATGECTGPTCFARGTSVATPAGPVDIASLVVGDVVRSYDVERHEFMERRVVRTMQTPARPLVALELATSRADGAMRYESIRVTPEHPFWIGHAWRAAARLDVGDALGVDGATHVVSAHSELAPADVFNIEVDGTHTYFVGSGEVLVHNACEPTTKKLLDEAAEASKEYDLLSRKPIPRPGVSFKAYGGRIVYLSREARREEEARYEAATRKVDAALKRKFAAIDALEARYRTAKLPDADRAKIFEALEGYLSEDDPDAGLDAKKVQQVALELKIRLSREFLAQFMGKRLTESMKKSTVPRGLTRLVQLVYVRTKMDEGKNRYATYGHREAVDSGISVLQQDPAVRKELAVLAAKAAGAAEYKMSKLERWPSRLDYFKSEAFQRRLKILSPEKAEQLLLNRAALVSMADPDAAKDLLAKVAGKHLHDRIVNRPQAELEKEIHAALMKQLAPDPKRIKEFADITKRVSKVSKALADAAKTGKVTDASDALNAEQKALSELTKGRSDTLFKVLLEPDRNGKFTVTAATIGAILLAGDVSEGKAFKDAASTFASIGTIAKTIDSAEGFYKLANWLLGTLPDKVGDPTFAGRSLAVTKYFGAAGDGLAAMATMEKLKIDAANGDVTSAYINATKYGALLASFTAGTYLAVAASFGAATGPAWPAVMLAATIVYIGAGFFEDSDEQIFMKKLGVHQ
jgi:hypothetical protein